MTYANGRIPTSELTALSTHGWLMADAAASYERMRKILPWLIPTSAGDAYREHQRQVNVFVDRYVKRATGNGPFGDVRWWNGVRYVRVKGASAAVPGTSNHGLGRTADFAGLGGYGGARFKELAAIAADHGWNNREGRSVNEPWHWTYVAANDKQRALVGWHHVTAKTKGAKGARCYKTPALGKPKNITRVRPLGSNIKIVIVVGPWGLTKRGDWIRMAKLTKGRK